MIQIEDRTSNGGDTVLLPEGIVYGAYKPRKRRKCLRSWVYIVGLAAVFIAAGIFA